MLFDCSDVDLLRLAGFLKNLPAGQEEKYSLRLLIPSVLGPLQEYGYGKLSKTIPKPKDTVIHAMKAEMEKSKGFRDMLKKAKDRDFTCKVRPHIAAQSKGIASYKGIFSSLEEMEKAPKVINLVPARDGPCVRNSLPGIRPVHHQGPEHPGVGRNSGGLCFQPPPHPLFAGTAGHRLLPLLYAGRGRDRSIGPGLRGQDAGEISIGHPSPEGEQGPHLCGHPHRPGEGGRPDPLRRHPLPQLHGSPVFQH